MSPSDVSKVLEFCFRAFTYVPPAKKEALFAKLESLGLGSGDAAAMEGLEAAAEHLTAEEMQTVETLRSRRMIREDPFDMDSFALDTIDGLAPRLERGRLGLARAARCKLDRTHFFSPSLDVKVPGIRENSTHGQAVPVGGHGSA